MKFITNRIPLSSGDGFGDFVKKALADKQGRQVKTAQAEESVAAAAAGEGPDEVAEKIESTADAQSSTVEAAKVAESANCCDNAEDANDGMEAEKGKFPEDQKVEGALTDTESSSETEIKVAEEDGGSDSKSGCDQNEQDCVEKGKFPDDFKPEQESGEENGMEHCAETDSEEKTKEASTQKEAGELPEALKEHQFKAKGDDSDDSDDEEEKEACEASSGSKEAKEADSSSCDDKVSDFIGGYTKIANLTPEQKKRLDTYWRSVWPESYVDAITQDR